MFKTLTAIRWPLFAALAVGWIVMLAGWPYGLVNPVTGPLRAILRASHFPNEVSFLWFGGMLTSTHLPWYYLPVSLIIRSPLTWILLFPAGSWLLIRSARSRDKLPMLALLVALILPIALIVLTGAALYNGIRHVLFLLPLLSVISAIPLGYGWEGLGLRPPLNRWMGRTACLVLAFMHLGLVIPLHPYEYTFLNSIAGNTWASPGRFEVDDYGHAMREAWRRLAAHHRAGANAARPGRVLVPQSGQALGVDDLPALRRTMNRRDADYLLLPPPRPGASLPAIRHLFSISRLGVPMLSAWDLRRSGERPHPK